MSQSKTITSISLIAIAGIGVLALLWPTLSRFVPTGTSQKELQAMRSEEALHTRAQLQEVEAKSFDRFRLSIEHRCDVVRKAYMSQGRNEKLSGKWLYDASRVFAVSDRFEDTLLGHELAILALSQGEKLARDVALKTEDRMLIELGKPQRFGTQIWAASNGLAPEGHRIAMAGDLAGRLLVSDRVAAAERRANVPMGTTNVLTE